MFNNNLFYNLLLQDFLNIRLHIGHKNKYLEKTINSYLEGFRHDISIFRIIYLWQYFIIFLHSIKYMSYYRNTFFLINTQFTNYLEIIINYFLHSYPLKINKFTSFYINGYINNKWIGGLFSNWWVTMQFLKKLLYTPLHQSQRRRYQRYLVYLNGCYKLRQNLKPFPDYVIFLNSNQLAITEIYQLDFPLFGLIDSNINKDFFLYKFYGNNDAIESIIFFFEIIREGLQEGRSQEQEQFFFLLRFYIKSYLKYL